MPSRLPNRSEDMPRPFRIALIHPRTSIAERDLATNFLEAII